MGLKTLVKLSQVTNLSDARYAAGMGVQMIGFNIDPESEFYVEPEKYKEITGWISGVDLVGEFKGDVFSYNAGYTFEYIQISNKALVQTIKGMKKKIIFELDLDKSDESEAEKILSDLKDDVDYFLLTKKDDRFNSNKLKSWSRAYPIILGFGFNEETIGRILQENDLRGIAIRGGIEKVVGFKDYDQLSSILEILQTEDA